MFLVKRRTPIGSTRQAKQQLLAMGYHQTSGAWMRGKNECAVIERRPIGGQTIKEGTIV